MPALFFYLRLYASTGNTDRTPKSVTKTTVRPSSVRHSAIRSSSSRERATPSSAATGSSIRKSFCSRHQRRRDRATHIHWPPQSLRRIGVGQTGRVRLVPSASIDDAVQRAARSKVASVQRQEDVAEMGWPGRTRSAPGRRSRCSRGAHSASQGVVSPLDGPPRSATSRNVVDLPEPDGPSSDRHSLLRTSRSRPSKRDVPPPNALLDTGRGARRCWARTSAQERGLGRQSGSSCWIYRNVNRKWIGLCNNCACGC